MKRVLILAYYFPPLAVSGSFRPAGFASHLEEFGFIPHIVSSEIPTSSGDTPVDESLLSLISNDLRIDRIGHTDWMQALLDFRLRLRHLVCVKSDTTVASNHTSNEPEEPDVQASGAVQNAIDTLQNNLFLFPDRQNAWIHKVYQHIKTLPKSERPDIVFATGNPWSTLMAGIRVAEYFDIPLISDFRDPWTENPKPPALGLAARAKRQERQIIEKSKCIIANTEALRDSFSSLYPDSANKIVTITNGYHESLIDSVGSTSPPEFPSLPVQLNYFGSTYELRKPTILLQALIEMVETEGITSNDIQIRFTGNWGVVDNRCNALMERLENAGVVLRELSVPHSTYLERLRTSHYLLVLQQGFPLQIPGKMYEYIASGRPLVVVGGEGATSSLVEKHDLGLVCSNDVSALKLMLGNLIQGQVNVGTIPGNVISEFSYRNLTRSLAKVLNAQISENKFDD